MRAPRAPSAAHCPRQLERRTLTARVLASCADDVQDSWAECSPAHEDASTDDEDDQAVLQLGGGRRLWNSSAVHPTGVKKWEDTRNCHAALEFECPCGRACLSRIGGPIELYKFRQQLRMKVQAKGSGGMRDVLRREMEGHYDLSRATFTCSFRIAEFGQVCERAFAVACAVSEVTFVRARADITKARGWHQHRANKRVKRDCEERRVLDGWVQLQRESMEGDKITGNKWYTMKTNEKQLWQRYLSSCDAAAQPAVGSSRLLHRIWKEHSEYKEVPPTGHAICNICGKLASERAALEGLVDRDSNEARKDLEAREAAHHAFHDEEYRRYERAVARATHVPEELTTITIDAPTMHQFDLPSQARKKRDTVKKLDGTNRWQSKLEGVLDAGCVASLPLSPSHTHQGY